MSRRLAAWLWPMLLLAGCGSAPTPAAPAAGPDAPKAAPPAPQLPAGVEAGDNIVVWLPNGVGVVTVKTPPAAGFAALGLGVACGTVHGRPGAAELAARAFVDAGDAGSGRPSLRAAVAALGGEVTAEVGRISTWFCVRVPAAQWQPALQALIDALSMRSWSRTQLARLQDELAQQEAQAISADYGRHVAARLLLADAGTGAFLDALLQRDPSEVALLQARHYRPEGTVLALQVAGDPRAAAAAAAPSLLRLAGWQEPAMPAEADDGARGVANGLWWAKAPGPVCRVLLLLPYPDPLAADAAVDHVLLNCLTQDGVGGRLELLQLQAGLGDVAWQAQFVQRGDSAGLLLSANVAADQALQLYELVTAARQSLLATPPSRQGQGGRPAEFELARRRAELTLLRREGDADHWLHDSCLRSLRAVTAAALQQRLQQLPEPGSEAFAAATAAWLRQPLVFAVVGGEPPAAAPRHREFELLPAAMLSRLIGTGPAAPLRAAEPLLDAAVAAAGGQERLRIYGGCEATAEHRTADAPTVDETWTWRRDGSLRQRRTVLGTAIDAAIDADGAREGIDGQLEPLPAAAGAARLRAQARHPLALLAAHARGELRFAWIATRRDGDRSLQVVEALSPEWERLRLCIDDDSGLIRTVEVWETTAEGTPVFLRETWSDYRSVLGLRVPFRRVTDVDDGSRRSETVWSAFTPLWQRP